MFYVRNNKNRQYTPPLALALRVQAFRNEYSLRKKFMNETSESECQLETHCNYKLTL